MDISLGFGQRTRFLRRLEGLTQEGFAEKLPIANQAMVTRIEKGKLESIRFEILGALFRIATEAGVPLLWYAFGDTALTLQVSQEQFDRLQGVDVPPGVQLVVNEPNEQTQGSDSATESDENDMDVGSHRGGDGG